MLLTGLLRMQGFDPNVGLFAATSDNRLYPNPNAAALLPEAMQLLEFLGRMLGKVCLLCPAPSAFDSLYRKYHCRPSVSATARGSAAAHILGRMRCTGVPPNPHMVRISLRLLMSCD